MKQKIIIAMAGLALLTACTRRQPQRQRAGKIRMEAYVKCTPVKDQGRSDLCWIYAMLATIESERLMMGDSVNLSPAFVARMMMREQATDYYFSRGKHPISLRGMASMTLRYMEKYGMQPYTFEEEKHPADYGTLCRKAMLMGNEAIAHRTGPDNYLARLDNLLDEETNFSPLRFVHMLGAEYTTLQFAQSVCLPGDYLSLTSFTHHPFFRSFELETPDNRLRDAFYNLPLDTLMAHIRQALRTGHPVCWEGDISEPGFRSPVNGCLVTEKEEGHTATQQERQRDFDRLLTTDDHAMEMVGMFRLRGRTYFVFKNSWGKSYGNEGFVYLSENYVRMKTIAVFMSRNAYKGVPLYQP